MTTITAIRPRDNQPIRLTPHPHGDYVVLVRANYDGEPTLIACKVGPGDIVKKGVARYRAVMSKDPAPSPEPEMVATV